MRTSVTDWRDAQPAPRLWVRYSVGTRITSVARHASAAEPLQLEREADREEDPDRRVDPLAVRVAEGLEQQVALDRVQGVPDEHVADHPGPAGAGHARKRPG